MANTVAYTSSNVLSGSLKSGVISININDNIVGQNYNWRNGIVFSNQYLIYSDTFTQGIDTQANAKPCAWSCDYNDTALLNLINSLPALIGQPKYSTLADAVAWLQGQGKYFIVNQNYPQIVTSNLILLFDAGFTGSYPVKGSNFYDVSGNGNSGTLNNGPIFYNEGTKSYFAFDGADDVAVVTGKPLITGTGDFTICAFVQRASPVIGNTDNVCGNYGASNNGVELYFYNNQVSFYMGGLYVNSSTGVANTNWHFVCGVRNSGTGYIYIDGVQDTNTGNVNTSIPGNNPFTIGNGYDYTGEAFYGNISNVLVYNKALSADEIKQNYYKGPIVTNGLVACYDAGNLVSYPGTSTTWYNMVSGGSNATLQNSPTYVLNESGAFIFDGTDDTASIPYNTTMDPTGGITLEAWIKPFDIANVVNMEIFRKEVGGARQLFSFQDSGTILSFGTDTTNAGYNELDISINASDYNGQWVHVVASYTSGFKAIYRNGVLIGSNNISGNLVQGNAVYYIGSSAGGGEFFYGEYGIFRMYNRGLTQSEILQNYNAQRNRFETNQAFATGGSVTTVNENGVRYRVHTFTSSGTLNVVYPGKMEVLCVAGGGGGGWGNASNDGNGGGGAGGVIYNTDYTVTTGNKTVTVGAGGPGGINANGSRGTTGDNSVFDSLTALGGGGGGSDYANVNGLNGGSGGGAGTSSSGGIGGTGSLPQGNNGGRADQPGGNGPGGGGAGGGGASADGQDGGRYLKGGNGGNGRQISINGTATYYGGGGAGSSWTSTTLATGGLGGGGNGASRPGGYAATAGTANTGGGGGAGTATQSSGSGGSGIVIVRYRI